MAANIDEETQKAIEELYTKRMNSIAQLRSTETQLEVTKRNIRREELVDAELAKVATGTKTYESCGRAFILRPLPEIREDLQQRVTKNKEKATTLEAAHTRTEASIREADTALQEIIARHAPPPSAPSAPAAAGAKRSPPK